MKKHMLKTDHEVFQASWDKKKNFEIRFDDRNFEVGDLLSLMETVYTGDEMKRGRPLKYTGRILCLEVIYKLSGQYGLKYGWCILGTSRPRIKDNSK